MTKHVKKSPKAYKNQDFLNSPSGRTVRLLSEYLEPYSRLKASDIKDTVVFFGSARTLPEDIARKNLRETEAKLYEQAQKTMGRTPPLLRYLSGNSYGKERNSRLYRKYQ